MAQRKTQSSAVDGSESGDLRHLLTAGGLVAGTLGTLLLGAALQIDPRTVALEPESVITAAPPLAGGSLAAPEPTPALPVPEPVLEAAPPEPSRPVAAVLSLGDRADDPQRLLNSGKQWTLQLMATCTDESAARLLRAVDGDRRLYVLPVSLDGRPCHRVCWEAFRSREEALAYAGVPAALRKIKDKPIAKKIADVAS